MPLRWADFDANFHLRHSVYYDFGATARLEFLTRCGLTYDLMQAEHFGPVLFREEAIFRREVRPGDTVYINLLVTKIRRDYSRYSFRHEITQADGSLCAVMNVDCAWIDTKMRKLVVLTETVGEKKNFNRFRKSALIKAAVKRKIEIIGEAMNNALQLDSNLAILNARRIVKTQVGATLVVARRPPRSKGHRRGGERC